MRLFAMAFVLLIVSTDAMAANWDAVPELEPREHFVVKRRFDGPRYNSLRACYRTARSQIGARYYGTLVDITDSEGSRSREAANADAFATHVATEWSDRVREENDIVLVSGIINRSVGVHLGKKWKEMGASQEMIADAIAGSSFPSMLNRRLYDDAMCELIGIVDLRVAAFEAEHGRKVAAEKEAIAPVEEAVKALEERVGQRLPEGDFDRVRTPLTAARDHLDKALAAVETNPWQSETLRLKIPGKLEEATLHLEGYLASVAELDRAEQEIATIRQGINNRPDQGWQNVIDASQKLEECEALAKTQRQGQDASATVVFACLSEVREELAAGKKRHYYLARAFPLFLFSLFVVIAALIVVLRWRRRRRVKHVLKPIFTAWQRGLTESGERLAQLEDSYPWYFQPRSSFWKGEDGNLDRQITDAIQRASVFQQWAIELLESTHLLYKNSTGLNVSKLEQALRQLVRSQTEVEAGQAHPAMPLSLPLSQSYSTNASEIFVDIHRALLEAYTGLGLVADTQQKLHEARVSCEHAQAAALTEVEARRAFGMDAARLTQELARADAILAQAQEEATQRPAVAIGLFDQARAACRAIENNALAGNRVLRGLAEQAQAYRAQIENSRERLSASRYEVQQRGYQPQQALQGYEDEVRTIMKYVASGRDQDAQQRLDALLENLDTQARRLNVSLEAPKLIPKVSEELAGLRDEVKERLFGIRMVAASQHGLEEVSEASEDVPALRNLVSRLDSLLQRVQDELAKGRVLTAASDLATIVHIFEQGTAAISRMEVMVDNLPGGARAPWTPPDFIKKSHLYVWGASADADSFQSLRIRS